MGWSGILAQLLRVVERGQFLLFMSGAGPIGWIKAIPDLWAFVGEAREFLTDVIHFKDTLKKVPEFKDAIDEARNTGNTSKLEKLFGGSGQGQQIPPVPPPHK